MMLTSTRAIALHCQLHASIAAVCLPWFQMDLLTVMQLKEVGEVTIADVAFVGSVSSMWMLLQKSKPELS